MSEITAGRGVRIDYVVDGEWPRALVLHGAYSTRDELLPVVGPLLRDAGIGGVYPDLPGMGESRPTTAETTGDVLDALDALIAAEFGDASFVVVGHSFGALVARGVAARHPDRVSGLALLSPFVDDFVAEPERIVVDDGAADALDEQVRGDYLGYFCVRTLDTRDRFERFVVPALGRYDGDAVERIMNATALVPDPADVRVDAPVLIAAGRDDSLIGWRAQSRLVDQYSRATFVAVSDAGHALIHERPHLVMALLRDLVGRTGIAGVPSATLGT